MHFFIGYLCLTELQLETLLLEALGCGGVGRPCPVPLPHPKTGQEKPASVPPSVRWQHWTGCTVRPHPALICGKPWPPSPLRSQGALMALLSSAQGHAVLLVSAVWTVPGGHWASRGPCCAIYKHQKIKPRGRGCRELGQFAGISPLVLCAFRGRLPELTSMLSVGLSVFEGPPPGCPSLGVTQKGPLGLPLGLGSVGGAPGKGTPLPKHVNPLLTKRKGFQGPSGLEEGSGGWGCPFENLNSDGCQFNKGFPDSGLGALGTGPCRGTPLERPLGGCCLVTWPSIHWAPLGAPRLLSRDNAGPRTKAGSSPQGPSSSPLPLCSWQ